MATNASFKPSLRVQTAPLPTPSASTTRAMATPPMTPLPSSAFADWDTASPGVVARTASDLASARRRALVETPACPMGRCSEDVERGSRVSLGSGAWSAVVRGTLASKEGKTTVAIKKPCYPGADKVLRQEAEILAYITAAAPSDSIVKFFGFEPTTSTVVMEYVPGMTLADYARGSRRKRAELKSGLTTAVKSQPVMGLSKWLDLSIQLVDTFVHLKRTGVVHGDVTWHNVLIKESQTESGVELIPVVIDFSSGHLDVEGHRPGPVSATTTAFCSPELLEAHIRRPITPPLSPADKPAQDDHGPCPTYASDLYGLAMTLLSAAIGTEVYENAGRHGGIYARQGQPLEWVRNGEAFLIVGVRTALSKSLMGCFGRVAEKRVAVEELRDRLVSHIDSSI